MVVVVVDETNERPVSLMGRLQETKFSLPRNIKREKAGEIQRKRKGIKT